MSKVVFVNSINNIKKNNNFTNGLFSLGSVLKKEGYSVRIIDFDYLLTAKLLDTDDKSKYDVDYLSDYILEENPDIISFYTMGNSYYHTIQLSKKIREKNKIVKILFGGPQATLSATETLKLCPWIDGIGLGEGEKTIVPIIDTLLKDNIFSDEKGIAYNLNGEIVKNEGSLLQNLDELVEYDYELLEGKITTSLSLEVGRGCPFGCKYCSTKTFWKRKFRLKSSNRILNEIIEAIKLFNINKFEFQHDLFTVNKSKVIEFCKKVIDANLNIEWGCSSRVDTLDEDVIKKMSEAGCKAIFLGIETGSSRMQKIINKNLNLESVLPIVKILNKYNIQVTTSLIYGFPEESIDDIRNTLTLIKELILSGTYRVQLHLFTVFPGTEYMDLLKEDLYYSGTFSDISIGYDVKEEDKLFIEENKELFSQYLDFNVGIRNELEYLDVYVYRYLKYFLKYFYKTYSLISGTLHDDWEIFKKFRAANISKLIKNRNPVENSIVEFGEIINAISNLINEIESANKSILQEIFKFETDIVNFMYYDKSNKKIKNYNYDVYSIKNNDLKEGNVNKMFTKIEYTRLSNKYQINIRKVA